MPRSVLHDRERVATSGFSQRASPRDLPERMDGDCNYQEFRECLRSLEQVNRLSLGYRPTLAWLGRLELEKHEKIAGQQGPIHIVDVGSGGGGLLRAIAAWARKRDIAVRLTGIDLNPYAAKAAAESTPAELGIQWVTSDALAYRPEKPINIIVSSLMAHHLEDGQIVAMLRWMEEVAQTGWFINDLERSQLSARAFGLLARVVGWHPFVQHDGPVSFRRAFRKDDWQRLLAEADVPLQAATIEPWRPARLCVGRWK